MAVGICSFADVSGNSRRMMRAVLKNSEILAIRKEVCGDSARVRLISNICAVD